MPIDEISGYVDLSNWKVWDILGHFKRTGDINVPKHEQPTLHESLQDEDIQVLLMLNCLATLTYAMKHLFNTLSSTPDLYLDELWLELQKKHGVSVSISTIWKTLKRGGYSMYNISSWSHGGRCSTNIQNSSLALQLSGVLRNEQILWLA